MAGRYICRAVLLAAAALGAAAQDDLPAGKGRETLETTCTECHGLDRVLDRMRTLREWRDIAARMRSKGATMTDPESDTLVDYLLQNFGKDEKPKVNVNRASAREMEDGLGLSSAEAAAIVRHRTAHGPFREWRDLTKVEGLKAAKVVALKDRLAF